MQARDHELVMFCEKIRHQEKKICEYAVKYRSDNINFDLTKRELDFLNKPQKEGFIPLNTRLTRYL